MMTPNVERTDPFLVVHSKHLDLLKDYGVVNANLAVRTLDLTASDLGESTHELNTNEETSSESAVQTTWNDLGNGVRPGTISVRNEGGLNENGNNEDQLSDGEEIVVLSEEAQNIFWLQYVFRNFVCLFGFFFKLVINWRSISSQCGYLLAILCCDKTQSPIFIWIVFYQLFLKVHWFYQ